MTVARGFGLNGKSLYTNVAKPMDVSLSFVVDSTNGNGLGLRSLKSNGYVRNVFMHTSSTPGSNNGALNPNPLAGFALIQLTNTFNKVLGGFKSMVSPVTGSSTKIDNAALTAGQAYVITVLGDASTAKWQSIGVPAGVTPAVGLAFIATNTGTGSNALTSRVATPGVTGITAIETVGDSNLAVSNSSLAANGGAYILVQFLGATDASTTTLIPKAPANGSAVAMTLRFDGSSVTIDGL